MKVALLTIWHEYNYGAELQAYATVKILKHLGHDVEMIDIRLSDQIIGSTKKKIVNKIQQLSPYHRKFDSFWRRYIPTTRRFRSLQDIMDNPPVADCYMVGSDQVWNPDITRKFSLLYFLNFGKSETKRISYASSFGVSKWSHNELTAEIKRLLINFVACTCREASGVKILKQNFDIEANRVLDPTLLFDNYEELTGLIHERKTLAYYPLSSDSELEAFAKQLGNELKLTPVDINKKKKLFKNIVWNRPSIEQWVTNIAESQFVITRSFHGLAFSLIYSRQFAIIAVRNDRAIRVLNLLEELGLEDRFFSSVEELNIKRPWEKIIDYEIVGNKLHTLRSASIESLNKMLAL
jgi:hypothetical protein